MIVIAYLMIALAVVVLVAAVATEIGTRRLQRVSHNAQPTEATEAQHFDGYPASGGAS